MLQLNCIVKSFPSKVTPILNGIDLTLERGDFCVVIGSNGSGKSTLLKTLSGEYTVDSGNITLNNKNISSSSIASRARYISSVSQDVTIGTTSELTLLENLCLSGLRGKNATFSLFDRHEAILKEKMAALKLGLENYLHTPLIALSGGQRQMIATIMALHSHPQLLLLDEHCSALDPKTQLKVMAYTNEMISKQEMTTLMITHHLSDAIRYGNRLIMLADGKIVLDLNAVQKQTITVNELIDLFHTYEDNRLVEGDLTC